MSILEELAVGAHRKKEALWIVGEGLEAMVTVERDTFFQAVEKYPGHAIVNRRLVGSP